MNLTGIEGKAYVVTGAAQGIGEGIARALGQERTRLVLVDINGEKVRRVAAEIGALGSEAVAVQADVSCAAPAEAAVALAVDRYGRLDGLVNVAGILRPSPVVEQTEEDWDAVLGVNAKGCFLYSRAAARRMIQQRSGNIVSIASQCARVPRMELASYCASKAAISLFMKCLGLELAQYGIRCNSVCPGSAETDQNRQLWSRPGGGRDKILHGSLETYRVGIPLGKLGQPEDTANAVLFLLSDQASHITMADLYVDGGGTLV